MEIALLAESRARETGRSLRARSRPYHPRTRARQRRAAPNYITIADFIIKLARLHAEQPRSITRLERLHGLRETCSKNNIISLPEMALSAFGNTSSGKNGGFYMRRGDQRSRSVSHGFWISRWMSRAQ